MYSHVASEEGIAWCVHALGFEPPTSEEEKDSRIEPKTSPLRHRAPLHAHEHTLLLLGLYWYYRLPSTALIV